jgi:hypothetical protein
MPALGSAAAGSPAFMIMPGLPPEVISAARRLSEPLDRLSPFLGGDPLLRVK